MSKFTHLHVHTEYSLLDGASRIDKLIDSVKEKNMDSIAITDHGVMYGVVNFYKTCKKKGVKPILGCEVYVTDNRFDRGQGREKKRYHLVLLAKDNKGYENLMKIVSEGFVNGFYYKPRVDFSVLEEYSEGLICLTACLGGEVQKNLLNGNYDKAKEIAIKYNELFKQGNFYLELQDHGIEEQKLVNQQLMKISKETGIPLVATNDTHYVEKSDAKMHDVLLCIQTGRTVDEEDRMKFPSDEFYLKSPEEMEELFPYAKSAIENTVKIAEMCNVELDFDTIHLPEYEIPEGFTNKKYLRHLCNEGLKKRYKEITNEIKERLEYELSVIENMGYVDYFLIVWDFIKYARDNKIMVGPGRGSAVGSVVSYTLEITDIDPIKYSLIFERFLNPERVSMPDIDIDFCYERREEVIDYVIRKYGEDKVAQIATFGTMAARGAIRDVGRALNISYGEVDYIAKQIPMELKMTIKKALDVSPKFKEAYNSDERIKELIDMALAVEGLPRHTSTHAAGVVISKNPVLDYVPLARNGEALVTQFTMTELEELGLLKMDFLGLRNLTVIRDVIDLIERNYSKHIDFSEMDYDDSEVYKIFARGETLGVFQFESAGIRQFLKELKPENFENIVAANALYRPGPMSQIPRYISSKNDPENVMYTHEKLKPILDVTYGCMAYQEQVMQIVRDIGGFSMGRADLVRRAMGKKKMEVMEQERKHFVFGKEDENGNLEIEGAIRRGVDETSANKIYDEMIDFGKYAFNKSHSAAYAVLAYETAYLKHYYPVEFMAGLMTSVMGNTNSIALYMQECKRLKIEVLPPDINESFAKFTVSNNKIRFGLSAVKNVGTSVIEKIVKERELNGKFEGLSDFIERVEDRALNKRAVESLIKCGAFDFSGANRSQMLAVYEKQIEGVHKDRKTNLKGQASLFDLGMGVEEASNKIKDNYPNIKELPEKMLLAMEKEMLGVFITGHPLSEYEDKIKKISSMNVGEINEGLEHADGSVRDGKKIRIAGIVSAKKTMITKSNSMMAFMTLEDLYGPLEVLVFPKIYDRYSNLIEEDNIVVVEGRLNIHEEEEAKIICDKIKSIEDPEFNRANTQNSKIQKLYVKIAKNSEDNTMDKIKTVLKKYSGNNPVYVYFEKDKKTIMANRNFWVDIKYKNLLEELNNIVGKECVVIK